MAEHTQICGGLTKRNKPCNITWGLDALGYCKFHMPFAPQCWGIARSTGKRCGRTRGVGNDGYCIDHQRQAVQQFMTATTRDVTAPVCQGVYNGSRAPCTNPPKPRSAYCCSAHNPNLSCVSPRLFDSAYLTREYQEDKVVARYKGKDAYHFDALDLATRGRIEMDHILEKQCFAYAFRYVDFRGGRGEMKFVAGIVRDEIVNEPANLCLTRMETNRIKGSAVWKFLDDCITNHVGHRGNYTTFTGYMMAETRANVRLGRQTTRVITKEMGSSLKRCQRQLAAEGDTPSLDALSEELQRLYVAMQLHTRERR